MRPVSTEGARVRAQLIAEGLLVPAGVARTTLERVLEERIARLPVLELDDVGRASVSKPPPRWQRWVGDEG